MKDTIHPNQSKHDSSPTVSNRAADQRSHDSITPSVKNVSDSGNTGKQRSSDVLCDDTPQVALEGLSKTLCLSLLDENITCLEPSHRKAFIQGLCYSIERCVTVEVLLEIVRIVGTWVTWRQKHSTAIDKSLGRVKSNLSKEPLVLKEKVLLC